MKRKHPKHKSTRISAERVKAIIAQWYEPGRQDRCKEWIYRNHVKNVTGISRRTFFRYMKEYEEELAPEDHNQLKLFE